MYYPVVKVFPCVPVSCRPPCCCWRSYMFPYRSSLCSDLSTVCKRIVYLNTLQCLVTEASDKLGFILWAYTYVVGLSKGVIPSHVNIAKQSGPTWVNVLWVLTVLRRGRGSNQSRSETGHSGHSYWGHYPLQSPEKHIKGVLYNCHTYWIHIILCLFYIIIDRWLDRMEFHCIAFNLCLVFRFSESVRVESTPIKSVCESTHLEVNLCSPCGHTLAECRGIDPTITLTDDEELILCEVWKLGKETLQS